MPMKIPPAHQVILVNHVPACRVPMNASGDELTPPKLAAIPDPLPACSRIAAMSTKLSRMRRLSRVASIGRSRRENS